MRRYALSLSMLVALVVFAAFLHGNVWRAASHVEVPFDSDWFGYMRQARLFKELGPIGGLDTSVRDPTTAYLLEKAKALGGPPSTWGVGFVPQAHRYKESTDRIVLQYPPGTGFLFSLFPEGLQSRLAFVAYNTVLLIALVLMVLSARTANVPILVAMLGAISLYGLQRYRLDWSIPPTILACVALAYLTVAVFRLPVAERRFHLVVIFGLLAGVSVSFRIANAFLLVGFALAFAVDALQQRSWNMLARGVWFGVAVVAGLLPVLVANTINVGHPLATTYGGVETRVPSFQWDQVVAGVRFYLVENNLSSEFLLVAALLTGAFILLRRRVSASATSPVLAAVLGNLLFSVGYMMIISFRIHYYLIPVSIYAASTILFAFILNDYARDEARLVPRPALALRVFAGILAIGVPAFLLRAVPFPVSTNYTRPNIDFALERDDVIWAHNSGGYFHYFLRRQASDVPASQYTFYRLIGAVARDGRRQYVVADTGGMLKIIERLGRTAELRRAGNAFGSEVFQIERPPSGN